MYWTEYLVETRCVFSSDFAPVNLFVSGIVQVPSEVIAEVREALLQTHRPERQFPT